MAEHIALTEATPASEHSGGFPPFQKETFGSQILWFVICFAALYVIVAKLVLPRLEWIITARQGKIAGDLAEAARLKGEAEGALAAYQKALGDAHERAHALASAMREKMNAEAEENRRLLEQRLNKRLAEADAAIAKSKAAAMANVRGIAVDTAGSIVARLTGVEPTKASVKAAVDGVMQR